MGENPAKLARKRFGRIKKENPEKAQKIERRASGEIYGLYPAVDSYRSSRIVEAKFKNGKLIFVE